MRTILLLLSLSIANAPAFAASKTIQVSPSQLEGWIVTGNGAIDLATLSTLVLPAGTQISRSFDAETLKVTVTSQPVVEEKSLEWPVIEIGAVALVIAREGDGARVMAIREGKAPAVVPGLIRLDIEGRSEKPLIIALTRSGGNWMVQVAQEKITLEGADDRTVRNSEIVISAGDSTPWIIDGLEITWEAPLASVVETDKSGDNSKDALETKNEFHLPTQTTRGLTPFQQVGDAGPKPDATQLRADREKAAGALEIFTPSSFRQGRADAARSAAAQAQLPSAEGQK